MEVREMNSEGIQRFEAFLESLRTQSPFPIPTELLTDETTSVACPFTVNVEERGFKNRYEAAKYFDQKFGDTQSEITQNAGLWTWLSLFYFEQICPKKHGSFCPGQKAQWIFAPTDPFRYYRHFLAGPYQIYQANRDAPERAMLFLYSPVETVGHFYYQLVARMEYVTNPSIVELATELYYDPHTGQQKRGAQTHGKPGTVFRFATFLNQLDRTWDLYSISTNELRSMLPSEFDRFLRPVTAT